MYNYCHGELLSWVEGNDVFLKARVYEKVVTDADSSSSEGDEPAGNAAGTVEERAVDLTAFDDVEVELVKSFGARTDIETAIDQTEDNCLVVHCPHTLESGEYALEIRLMKDGIQARSFDIQFAVVQTDCKAQTTFEVIDGCRSASLRVTLQVVSQALVRGKSAYELWKELPGNEDKGLQDFIDEVLDLTTLTTEAGNVNASLSGTILTVTNRYGESESVDVKDQMMLVEVDDDMQLSVTKADDSTVVFGLENGYLTVDDTDNGSDDSN